MSTLIKNKKKETLSSREWESNRTEGGSSNARLLLLLLLLLLCQLTMLDRWHQESQERSELKTKKKLSGIFVPQRRRDEEAARWRDRKEGMTGKREISKRRERK